MGSVRVIVGMSGGVDSSVAAALLLREGVSVEGVSLQLWDRRGACGENACCSLESAEMAHRVASILGIPHRVVDARGLFMEEVIAPFAEAYARGRTPNPCILCNERVKFPLLLKQGQGIRVATGHYARVMPDAAGDVSLLRGRDPGKDQAYFLYSLGYETLSRLLLPLGQQLKRETRKIAAELELPVSERPESQEICFVGDEGYDGFLHDLSPGERIPGPIVDTSGKERGTHGGISRYTVGQRKRLGIASPVPLYVVRIDATANTIVVGTREEAEASTFEVSGLRWLIREPPAPGTETAILVKVRSTTAPRAALLRILSDDRGSVTVEEPVWAPAPGQAAVFYDGDRVLGGGEID